MSNNQDFAATMPQVSDPRWVPGGGQPPHPQRAVQNFHDPQTVAHQASNPAIPPGYGEEPSDYPAPRPVPATRHAAPAEPPRQLSFTEEYPSAPYSEASRSNPSYADGSYSGAAPAPWSSPISAAPDSATGELSARQLRALQAAGYHRPSESSVATSAASPTRAPAPAQQHTVSQPPYAGSQQVESRQTAPKYTAPQPPYAELRAPSLSSRHPAFPADYPTARPAEPQYQQPEWSPSQAEPHPGEHQHESAPHGAPSMSAAVRDTSAQHSTASYSLPLPQEQLRQMSLPASAPEQSASPQYDLSAYRAERTEQSYSAPKHAGQQSGPNIAVPEQMPRYETAPQQIPQYETESRYEPAPEQKAQYPSAPQHGSMPQHRESFPAEEVRDSGGGRRPATSEYGAAPAPEYPPRQEFSATRYTAEMLAASRAASAPALQNTAPLPQQGSAPQPGSRLQGAAPQQSTVLPQQGSEQRAAPSSPQGSAQGVEPAPDSVQQHNPQPRLQAVSAEGAPFPLVSPPPIDGMPGSERFSQSVESFTASEMSRHRARAAADAASRQEQNVPQRQPMSSSPHWSDEADHMTREPVGLFGEGLGSTRGPSSGPVATPALVVGASNTLLGPLSSTGEIILTGSINLPRSYAAGNGSGLDDSDADDLDDSEQSFADQNAPVRAARAVGAQYPTSSMVTSKGGFKSWLPTVLAISAAVICVSVLGVLVGIWLNLF